MANPHSNVPDEILGRLADDGCPNHRTDTTAAIVLSTSTPTTGKTRHSQLAGHEVKEEWFDITE